MMTCSNIPYLLNLTMGSKASARYFSDKSKHVSRMSDTSSNILLSYQGLHVPTLLVSEPSWVRTSLLRSFQILFFLARTPTSPGKTVWTTINPSNTVEDLIPIVNGVARRRPWNPYYFIVNITQSYYGAGLGTS
jgi:hypothetical protein